MVDYNMLLIDLVILVVIVDKMIEFIERTKK